jgi:hypothetical protein
MDENGASAEDKAAFAKACKEVLEKVRANIKDYEFLIGESMDEGNGMYVFPQFSLTLYWLTLTLWTGSSSSTTVRMVSPPT